MTSIEVKYLAHDKPGQKSNNIVITPLIKSVEMHMAAVQAVHSFMAGTDSNEWLLLAEKKAYEFIKK